MEGRPLALQPIVRGPSSAKQGVGPPPVYRPQQTVLRSPSARAGAPPVYRPQQTLVRPPSAGGGAPPVYRPQQTIARSAVPKAGAPPRYQPFKPVTQRQVAPTARVIQREVNPMQAVSALNEILVNHGQEEWYKTNWANGTVRRIATEVAERADTDKDNLKSRLQSHAEITPLLRAHRLRLEPPDKKLVLDSADEAAVYEAVEALTFYHVSKFADDVRVSGLDPSFGGKEGGISDERSVGGQREKNIKGSKGKVFVTRKWSEAKQYAEGDQNRVIRVIIPPDKLDQGKLQVDPDSMFGLSQDALLKAMDVKSRHLDWWAASYVSEYLTRTGQLSARDNLAPLYARLVEKGAFLPPVIEAPRTLPQPITAHSGEVMSEQTIALELQKLKKRLAANGK
jgi:hypothetical protein